ncbi:hypothetical protein IEO21_03446 [Rhodonia placenta]|uniref:ER membrane protein complex subunit 1 n=1 Tax=Rhodonia placenta TaxID=104341 RepID=A0A8H7P5R3_9APHY|nr:hypothetical protein IEO21_03446 [Postia placenta]
MRLLSVLITICCLTQSWALHSSEAGIVDWHKPLVGVPLYSTLSTAPAFHRISEADGRTHSVVLTATASNVLAALDPVDGTIAWRHIFEANEHVIAYKQHGNVVATVSGSGGATLRLLDATTGHLLVERCFHKLEAGRLFEPETLGTALAFDNEENGDTYVLSNAHILRRTNAKTGEVVWGWSAPDQASLVAYSRLIATSSTVYVVGLAKSFTSYTLHVSAVSAKTGEFITSIDVPSSITNGLTDFFVLASNKHPQVKPRVMWLEGGAIKSFPLTPELKETPMMIKGAEYQKIVDVGFSEHGQFVAIKEDGAGRVIRLGEDGVKVIWEFAESATSKQYTESIYSGGLDKDGWPYIARVYWSHISKKASAHILAAHLADGKGLVTGFTLPFQTSDHGVITHVAVDIANPEEFKVLARLFLTTSTGAVQLWQQNELQWSREEGLAEIKVAELVELPEKQVVTAHAGEDEPVGERLVRQLSDARDFPQYALNFARRFVTGSYASVSSSVAPSANASEPLARDEFGFRKVIIAVTARSKIYGIDSANGEVLWSRVFGLGWAAEVGGHIIPVKIFVTRTVNDGGAPEVVLVTQRKASNSLVDTVIFHVNPLTGEDVRDPTFPRDGLLQGLDVIAGPLVETYMLQLGPSNVVALLDEFVQVHLYPNTDEIRDAFVKALPSIYLPLRTGAPRHRQLTGHQISPKPEFTGKHVAQPTWTLSLPPSEDILAIIPRPREPIASLGKVLGNRTTLYKYLNPHLSAVVAGSSVSCSLYLIDSAKGTVLYHVVLPSTDGACDIKVVLAENWLVYQYYDGDMGGVDQAKSYRIVSVELYEGSGVDDKTRSSDLSSLSNKSTAITTFEETFVLPRAISTIVSTATTHGITMKDIIVASENHQIQSFPRRFLDPRRPKRKPTNEELEEWLIQYDPILPDDPKRVLSHTYQVVGTKHIVTSPALLESTSLVFAYGQDLFFTRVAPSNTFDVLSEDFNKAQLVLTIAGLALAIVIAKPMVRRKRLREKWYDQ